MSTLVIKTTQELTDSELHQVSEAIKREFQTTLPDRKQLESDKRKYFLLMEEDKVLAMGQLLMIDPVIFMDEIFSLCGIGGIIANEKGQGYGKKIMTAIKSELISIGKTGMGFCKLKNKGFYEKCGFNTETSSLERFIYHSDKSPFPASKENECVLYLDGNDNFMEKVLSNPTEKISIPIPPIW